MHHKINRKITGLTCDLYSLTMAQGYWEHAPNSRVVFDFFFRATPFGGGFVIFAGLETLLQELSALRFTQEDIEYLGTLGLFSPKFLQSLLGFSFRGDIYSVREGEVVFPQEPVLRVHANVIEAQIIEALLLNILNFQSLIATKTARIYLASNKGTIVELGLRRAQGVDGAISASRASYVGGASATSHVHAGRIFGIPVQGTMAHSWVMSFDTELEAFEKYARLYPDNSIFLLDTYDSLGSGIEAAITMGTRLQKLGQKFGVRLDSGDMHYLSLHVRQKLDAAGLTQAKIVVSNELDEKIIHQLTSSQAPIDVWGVGTRMVTGNPDGSLSGVYKMAAKKGDGGYIPTMKVSENPEKSTNPGIKQVYRFYSNNGFPVADFIALHNEEVTTSTPYIFYHPFMDYRRFIYRAAKVNPLLTPYMRGGSITASLPTLKDIRANALNNLSKFDASYLRIINPHVYKVSISEELKKCKQQFMPTPKKINE